MKKHLSTVVFVTAVVAGLCSSAHGWGVEGHRITAEIAWRLLSPEARGAVTQLLGGESLPEVSTWADAIRSQPEGQGTAPSHYLNVKEGEQEFDMLRDAVHPNNVLGAIAYYESVLGWASSSKTDRMKALKFLIHYVADIHQPMHVSRAADKGGNDIKVKFFGRATARGGGAYNLHNVWDTHLIARANPDWRAYTEFLFDRIGPAQRESWARSDPPDWARESFAYALERCYAPVSESAELGEAYFAANRPIVELRLQQGGVRLASLLNKVLTK